MKQLLGNDNAPINMVATMNAGFIPKEHWVHESGGRIVNGLGADTDIIIASAKAYIHALNMLEANVQKAHPQV